MKPGTLFVVGTPIGNLEDISLRALRVLSEVQIIAAEDTRTAQHLLHAHGLWPRPQGFILTSYFQGNEASKTAELVSSLISGTSVALISEAGLPGISDPGHRLIKAAVQKSISIQVIPGPCAAVTGLVASGLKTDHFLFLGFPPKKKEERYSLFSFASKQPATVIFYESPARVYETILELTQSFGAERNACIAREMTKHFEEFLRGDLLSLARHLEQNPARGEITLMIEGQTKNESLESPKLEEEIALRLKQGEHPNDIALILAIRYGKPKRHLYQLALRIKDQT